MERPCLPQPTSCRVSSGTTLLYPYIGISAWQSACVLPSPGRPFLTSMETTPPLSNVSDDDSYDHSAGPITPESSPPFRPTYTSFIIENQQATLLNDVTTEQLGKSNKTEGRSLRPRVRSRNVENVCAVGAGYVGKSKIVMRPSQRP